MRALLSLILITTLLLAACGGGDGDDDSDNLAGGTPGNEASTTAGSGDSGSEPEDTDDSTAGGDGDATGQESDGGASASQGTGVAAASATLPPMMAEASRTPRPTSTPFPTATPLTMPPTATPPTTSGTMTPAPVPSVEVISSNIFRDPEAGSAIIFGEIQNTGDIPATGVQVSARLLDGAGNQIGRCESEAVGKTVVKPGDVVGFSVIVTFEDNVYTEWASEELSVDFEFSREDIVQAYTSDLAISGDTLVGPETGFDFVDVTGSLTNNSGKPLRFVQVGAIAYDASGNVISVDSFVTSDTVEPGATIPFAVEFSRGRLKEFPASYALVLEGLDASQ